MDVGGASSHGRSNKARVVALEEAASSLACGDDEIVSSAYRSVQSRPHEHQPAAARLKCSIQREPMRWSTDCAGSTTQSIAFAPATRMRNREMPTIQGTMKFNPMRSWSSAFEHALT